MIDEQAASVCDLFLWALATRTTPFDLIPVFPAISFVKSAAFGDLQGLLRSLERFCNRRSNPLREPCQDCGPIGSRTDVWRKSYALRSKLLVFMVARASKKGKLRAKYLAIRLSCVT